MLPIILKAGNRSKSVSRSWSHLSIIHFQINCPWLHQIEATVLPTFSLFGIIELCVELNKGELILQLYVEVSSSVLNKSDLLWLAINKAEINTEAILGL